jgi:hypothetical protein
MYRHFQRRAYKDCSGYFTSEAALLRRDPNFVQLSGVCAYKSET